MPSAAAAATAPAAAAAAAAAAAPTCYCSCSAQDLQDLWLGRLKLQLDIGSGPHPHHVPDVAEAGPVLMADRQTNNSRAGEITSGREGHDPQDIQHGVLCENISQRITDSMCWIG
jgi:hypothetical protein